MVREAPAAAKDPQLVGSIPGAVVACGQGRVARSGRSHALARAHVHDLLLLGVVRRGVVVVEHKLRGGGRHTGRQARACIAGVKRSQRGDRLPGCAKS